MNICITGALGHIGSKLIRNLSIPFLNKVYLVDNFFTQRYASLFNLPPEINYCFREIDILSEEMRPIIKDSDIVVHLAAFTNAEESLHHPELVDKINRQGLEQVARLCEKHHRRLIFPSTTSVYGPQSEVVDEDSKDSELNPPSPYAESKLRAERFLQNLSGKGTLNFVIIRLGTIFGYSIGMRFHTAVNKFIWQACAGEEVTVWKTALNQKRPYCGLNDCVHAINYIINEQIFDGNLYNIVTANLTVKEVLDVIREHIPGIQVTLVDSAIMNQLSYTVSNEKSRRRGFIYRDTIQDNARETIQHLRCINTAIRKKNL